MTGQEFSTYLNDEISNPTLKHVDLEITRECNLKCVHCSSGTDTNGRELSLQEEKELLLEAKSLGLETVGLTGGEPFLRFDKLTRLVDFCQNELPAFVHIHSNGTKIFRDEARWLKESEVNITLSIFGSRPETHDAITNIAGSMKSTLRGLRNLVKAKASLTAFVVPMRRNLTEIPSVIELVRKEGVEDVRILLPSPTGRAFQRFADIELSAQQLIWLRYELAKSQEEGDIRLSAGFCTKLGLPDLETLKGHDRCYAAKNRVHVDAFGNVYPCTASSGRRIFSAGNVLACPLTEIWRFSPSFQFLRKFHSNPVKKCQACLRFPKCMSGCRVRMSYAHGDMTVADPQCGGPYL
jgi:radical SAM protein with 4Fe4S-binding SPASM domain